MLLRHSLRVHSQITGALRQRVSMVGIVSHQHPTLQSQQQAYKSSIKSRDETILEDELLSDEIQDEVFNALPREGDEVDDVQVVEKVTTVTSTVPPTITPTTATATTNAEEGDEEAEETVIDQAALEEEEEARRDEAKRTLNYKPRTVLDYVHERERQIVEEHKEMQKLKERYQNAKVRTDKATGVKTIAFDHEDNPNSLNYNNLMNLYARREKVESRPVHDNLPLPGHGLYHHAVIEKKVGRSSEPYLPYKKEDIPDYQVGEILGTVWEASEHDESKTFGDRFSENDIAEALELYADHVLRKKILDPHKSVKYTKMVQVFVNQILDNRQMIEQYDKVFLEAVNTHGNDITSIQKTIMGKLAKLHARSKLAKGAVADSVSDNDIIRMEIDRELKKEADQINVQKLSQAFHNELRRQKLVKEKKIANFLTSVVHREATFSALQNVTDVQASEKTEDANLITTSLSSSTSSDKQTLYREEIEKLAQRGTMYDVSNEHVLQSRYFKDSDLQALFDKYVLEIDTNESVETRANHKLKAYENLFLKEHSYGESSDKLAQVGRFIDVILHLKYINNELENMITKMIPMMYASRVLIHDMVTCNKLLFICQTTNATSLTRTNEIEAHKARENIMEKLKSVVDQSEKEYNIIHHPYQVSKEPFYTSSRYIPFPQNNVRARQKQVRKY